MKKSKDKLSELEEFRNELVSLYNSAYHALRVRNRTKKETKEYNLLHEKIMRKSGYLKSLITELSDTKKYLDLSGKRWDLWSAALHFPVNKYVIYAMKKCVIYTTMSIGKLKDDLDNGLRDEQGILIGSKDTINKEGVTMVPSSPPKAFIAHEGETQALDKLTTFLDALGVESLIAEKEPSDGRQIKSQVDWTKSRADFAIILVTKGKTISKKSGKPQMGLNVADEFGMAKEVYKNHIILLLQHGVELHTNIGATVYEQFTPQSMDKAFTKVVKELRNWGYIKLSTEK